MALGGLLTLTNVGTSYDATNALKALGPATVEMTGFDTVKITVYVNKIGTGTQTLAGYGSLEAGADWHMSSNSPRPGSSPPAPRSTPYPPPLVLAVMYVAAQAQPQIEVTCQVHDANRVDPLPFS